MARSVAKFTLGLPDGDHYTVSYDHGFNVQMGIMPVPNTYMVDEEGNCRYIGCSKSMLELADGMPERMKVRNAQGVRTGKMNLLLWKIISIFQC